MVNIFSVVRMAGVYEFYFCASAITPPQARSRTLEKSTHSSGTTKSCTTRSTRGWCSRCLRNDLHQDFSNPRTIHLAIVVQYHEMHSKPPRRSITPFFVLPLLLLAEPPVLPEVDSVLTVFSGLRSCAAFSCVYQNSHMTNIKQRVIVSSPTLRALFHLLNNKPQRTQQLDGRA